MSGLRRLAPKVGRLASECFAGNVARSVQRSITSTSIVKETASPTPSDVKIPQTTTVNITAKRGKPILEDDPLVPTEGVKQEDRITATILSWKERRDTNSVIRALLEARERKMELDVKESVIGISACCENYSSAPDLAFWIFNTAKATQKVVPVEIYEKMLKFCLLRKLVPQSIEIMEGYKNNGYQLTEGIYSTMLTILAKYGNNNFAQFKLLQKLYDEYRSVSKTFGWRISAQLYMDISISFCKHHQGQQVLDVLHDMTNAHHEPSPNLCHDLLEAALFYKESKVLRVLSSWYSNHFHVRLEYGVLNRMLEIASSCGDGQLALVAFQMIAKNGYNPTSNSYFCLVRALLRSDDLISAVEALQEMESRRNTTEISEEDGSSYQNIKAMLVQNLLLHNSSADSTRSSRLDELYFALVDQAKKSKQIVPRVVLDSLVEASGKLDSVDRAFATFSEYKEVFGVEPSVESYNSLLVACALSSRCSIDQMLFVFQDMENSCPPNKESYTVLIEAMVNMGDVRIASEIVDHMEEKHIASSPRSLRRLISLAKKQGNNELASKATKFYEKNIVSYSPL